METANALQLEAARRRAGRAQLFLAKFVLRMRTNCYFAASVKCSCIAIRFSDPDFLKESNISISDDFSRCDLDLYRNDVDVGRLLK